MRETKLTQDQEVKLRQIPRHLRAMYREAVTGVRLRPGGDHARHAVTAHTYGSGCGSMMPRTQRVRPPVAPTVVSV
jgi:hypothetical protein